MQTRVLFLDDSGKPDVNHASGAVVIAGFAVASEDVATLSRRVLGAKGAFYPNRGAPQSWELKSASFVKPNPWKRSKSRHFVAELIRIVQGLNGTMYSATIVKNRMNHPMALTQTMPLELQCLVEHFSAECTALGATGMVVSDWSAHHLDHHASQCVASFAASNKLHVHPSVYYASSHASEGIQVADLVAAIRRRTAEGDTSLAPVDAQLRAVRSIPVATVGGTVKGRSFNNWINLF